MLFRINVVLITTMSFISLGGQILPEGFVFLENEIPNLIVDLRYSKDDNFLGKKVEGYKSGQKAIGTLELAKALKRVQKKLKPEGLGLKIYDAYRPQRAVNNFIAWSRVKNDTLKKSKYYPYLSKAKLFELGFIASKSGHSRGSTVDLTLVCLSRECRGKRLDMGGNWDFFGDRSNYGFEDLNKNQKQNRKKLRDVMTSYGFKPYDKEWWHFTLINEPYPNKYFDFTVE